jgi:hypothetical protein
LISGEILFFIYVESLGDTFEAYRSKLIGIEEEIFYFVSGKKIRGSEIDWREIGKCLLGFKLRLIWWH